MARIYPFRSLRYAADKVAIEKVVTQPYDKISTKMQDGYYAAHPNNVVRIVLGKPAREDSATNNVYTRAANYLREWRASGIIEQLSAPAFFAYFQTFRVPGETETHVRKGFIGLGRLENYENQIVFPHERTLTGPKKDRLELLRHTQTHFEQIFMLYDDPSRQIDRALDDAATQKPDAQVKDEYGVEHSLWTIMDSKTVDFLQRQMDEKRLIIADGHHRYETALAYRDEMGGRAGSDRMPMTFFNMSSPGLRILPTHRVLANLPVFDANAFFDRAAQYFDIGESRSDSGVRIGVAVNDRHSFLHLKPTLDLATILPDLSPKQRTLDVVILHRFVIEKCLGISEEAVKKESYITYVRERDAAVQAVREGKAQIAFLLNPTRLDQMRDIAFEGHVMPQKSTDFYPKVLSGLTMYTLE